MNSIKTFFSKHWMHLAAVVVFFIIARMYFAPQFDDYGLAQHDIKQFKGMSNEIVHFREDAGKEPLWTNSMFGGMPATQISVQYGGNVFKEITRAFISWFPSPAGIFLLHLIGFYIFALFMRMKPIIGFIGAIAFAFASYEIVILQAGHNSKALAVAFLPAVLGAFIYAFQRNWKWGAVLSAVFMGFELSQNHYQVTYYMVILLFGIGVYFAIEAFRKGTLKKFGFATAGVIAGYLIALMINYGSISMTNDYAKYTIRGANDLTISPDGSEAKAKEGLDKDYITSWSYGIDESFTIVSPYVKGSHNSFVIADSKFAEMVEEGDYSRDEQGTILGRTLYWGEQQITSGPVYLGVITVFLALLGMVFLKDRIKWVYLAVSVLALMLSWGKNFMGLTDFFIDNVPLYASFRTVTIILILLELTFPVIAVMVLQKLFDERENLKSEGKKFLIVSGAFLVFLIGLKLVGLDNVYSSEAEIAATERAMDEELITENILDQLKRMSPDEIQQFQQQQRINLNDPQQLNAFIDANVQGSIEQAEKGSASIQKFRKDVFSSSTTRSILFAVFGIGIIALFFYTSLPSLAIAGGLAVLMLIDFVGVDTNYIGTFEGRDNKYVHWVPEAERAYPMAATPADNAILEQELKENPSLQAKIDAAARKGIEKAREEEYERKYQTRVADSYKFSALNANTNYRVLETPGTFGSSRASYYHKSVGGYHGAKLRNYQNLAEFHLYSMNNNVLDMLNVKYIIQNGQLSPNRNALGNAWLVSTVKSFATPDDEIRALGNEFTLKNTGEGEFLVNGSLEKEAKVYGQETLQYIVDRMNPETNRMDKDTLKVPLSNGIQVGTTAAFVMDVNGQTDLIPIQTLEKDTVRSFKSLVTLTMNSTFNPSSEAVMLESEAKKLSKKQFTKEGTVKMTKYAPNQINYEADVNGKQLIVFSEMYYKDGWKAFVDGKEQEILKVNYALRGLEVDGGKHKIEFAFDIPKFHTAGTMAMIGSILIFLLVGGMFFMDFRKK
jgi:hypothetical protein